MDIQFYGANCIAITYKGARIVIDDNLAEIGGKSVLKADDVALFTGPHAAEVNARLVVDGPCEYEVSDISVMGCAAQAHHSEEHLASSKCHDKTINYDAFSQPTPG